MIYPVKVYDAKGKLKRVVHIAELQKQSQKIFDSWTPQKSNDASSINHKLTRADYEPMTDKWVG